jgi:hypothetical protein
MVIDVRYHVDTNEVELMEAILRHGYWIPRHFKCDGASIPRFAWSIIGHPFEFLPEALLHDYLCRTSVVPRSTADRLFRQDLEKNPRVNRWKSWVMYTAVKLYSLTL